MNVSDPLDRFAAPHAATARDLGRLLDVEAGLREVLVAVEHDATGRSLDLDVEAGLAAIVPEADPPAPPADATPPAGRTAGLVATLLLALDTPSRLALRTHPAIDVLGTALEIGSALDRAHDLVRALDPARYPGHERANDLARDLERALARTGARHRDDDAALDNDHLRNLDHALNRDIDRARDLARTLADWLGHDHGRIVADALARNLGSTRELARNLARGFAHDHTLPPDFSVRLDLDLDGDRDLGIRARALDLARHDFTTADLRGIDLSGLSLVGLRWSAATRWPSEEWRSQALLDSTELAGGVYEIRSGTTTAPTHAR